MNKLIFRKFSIDIVNFLISSFSVRYSLDHSSCFLDLVSVMGASLNIYFIMSH